MARITILGGGGAVGSVATATLAPLDFFSEIVVADLHLARARQVAAAIGSPRVSAVEVDVLDPSRPAVTGALLDRLRRWTGVR